MNINPNGRGAVRRRHHIVDLVRGQAVRSQEELGQLLRRRGFAVAQPTLSRDIKELGLARTPTGYAAPAGVVGTIAGDDTVFVATPDPATALRVARRLGSPLAAAGRGRSAPRNR